MTPAERAAQLDGWIELLRLAIGRNDRDSVRIGQVETEMRAARDAAVHEGEVLAAVDQHVKRAMGDT